MPQVRLIGDDGNQVGVVPTEEALRYAQERDLDLVEVAAEARPPVVRVLDYSKYKYEQEQKAKEARRHQKQVTVREIKLRPKIATNDYETKKGHVVRFLKHGDRVKITIMFRGRETTHPERGENLLMRLAEDVADLGTIESRPNLDGRNMTMLLAPLRTAEQGTVAEEEAEPPTPAPPKRERREVRLRRQAAEAAAEEDSDSKPKAKPKAKAKPKPRAKPKPKTNDAEPAADAQAAPEAEPQAEAEPADAPPAEGDEAATA